MPGTNYELPISINDETAYLTVLAMEIHSQRKGSTCKPREWQI
jgi:hypothetical protein